MCRTTPSEKGKYIKIIISLLGTNNTAVVYECASSLVAMSSAPTAIRAAANCYTQLLSSQSDNNVKLIVLDRLNELKLNHQEVRALNALGTGRDEGKNKSNLTLPPLRCAQVMQDMVMDVLRALSSPNMDIRRKTLDIALELITARNIDEATLGPLAPCHSSCANLNAAHGCCHIAHPALPEIVRLSHVSLSIP